MDRRIDDVRPQQGLVWDAKGAAMDRAGELPMERRKAERRAEPPALVTTMAETIAKHESDLDAYERLCQKKDAELAELRARADRTESDLKANRAGETVRVEFDLSPAQQETAVRAKLIELGWSPPDAGQDSTIAALKEQLAGARNAALEEAAKACDAMESDMFDRYKGRGKHAPNNEFRADPYMNGQSDGAGQCAAAIRALASQPAAPVQPQMMAVNLNNGSSTEWNAAPPVQPATNDQLSNLSAAVMALNGASYVGDNPAAWDGYERGFKAAQKEVVALIGAAPALPAEEVQANSPKYFPDFEVTIDAPPVQQPDDVREKKLTLGRLGELCDMLPADFCWGDGLTPDVLEDILSSALVTTRPGAALTEAQIDALITSHGTGGWQTVESMRTFARAILAASGGAEHQSQQGEGSGK